MDRDFESKIEVGVKLKLKDYLLASYWFLFRRWSMKLLLVFAFILAGLFFYTIIVEPNSRPYRMLILPSVVLLMVGSTYLSAKRNMASSKSLQENIQYTFSDRGIEVVAQSSSGYTSWGNIFSAYETGHNFLLFISRNQMYTIPKRCFRDAGQVAAFKQMLVRHVDKAKVK